MIKLRFPSTMPLTFLLSVIHFVFIPGLCDLSWTELTPATSEAPSARGRPALAYDDDNNLLLVFGGIGSSGIVDDTWIFDISSRRWYEINTSNSPGARFDAIGGYFNGWFIISTGEGKSKQFFDDIWGLDYTSLLESNDSSSISLSWVQLDASSSTKPEERYGAAGGLIQTNDKTNELYGKFYISHGFSDIRYSNTFVFDLNSTSNKWKQVFDGTTAYSADLPHPRCLVATTTNNKGFIMFGGCLAGGLAGGPCPALDSWYFNGNDDNSWTRFDDLQLPSANSDMCMYWGNGGNKYAILYGGDQSIKSTQKLGGTEINNKDLHFVDVSKGTWKSYDSNNAPNIGGAMNMHRMVSLNDGCIVFGGKSSKSGDYLNGVYYLNGTIDNTDTNGVTYTYFSVLYLHGIFMWLSWGVFLQMGGFMAHFFRKFKKAGYWFKPWHVYCQRIGYILSIIGIIFGFLGQGSPIFAHGIIGIIILILSTAQVISGEKRPHVVDGQPKSKKRIIFEIFHKKINGRLMLILSLINISLGVFLILAPVAVWVLWFIQLSIIVIAYIVFELDKQDIIKIAWMRNNEYSTPEKEPVVDKNDKDNENGGSGNGSGGSGVVPANNEAEMQELR